MTPRVSVGIHVPTSAVGPLASGEAYADFGITHLMLGVPTLDLAHLRRLAENVAPVARESSPPTR